MKKKLIIITATIVTLATLIITLLLVNRELELPRLTVEDISYIYRDTDNNDKIELDIEEFLGYYNQIYDLRDNKEGAGSTPTSRIMIGLKDGQEIGIYNSGKQFEVNFTGNDGERHQYWGRQQEIYNMLYKGFYKLK